MKAWKSIAVVIFSLTLFACGGGGGGGNDDGTARIQGTAFNPPGVDPGKVAAENSPIKVVDFSRPATDNVVATGTTDGKGRFDVTIPQSPVVAVIVQGKAQISGLIQPTNNAKSLEFNKDFDGATDIACRAGAQLLSTGVYTANNFGKDQIDNLEGAANELVDAGLVDFLDPNSVAAAVQTVLDETGNASHPF